MINRDLIRRKIVQLTYAYYQNSDHNMDNAEKELMFSLSNHTICTTTCCSSSLPSLRRHASATM